MGDLSGKDNFELAQEETAFIWRTEGKIEAVIPDYENRDTIQPESPTFWCLITCAMFSNHPEWLALRKQAVNLFLRQLNQHEEDNDDGQSGEEEVRAESEEGAAGPALPDSRRAAQDDDADAG